MSWEKMGMGPRIIWLDSDKAVPTFVEKNGRTYSWRPSKPKDEGYLDRLH